MCVCGIPNNVDNCERCRLIAELTAAQNRVAELEIAAKLGKRLGKIVDKLRPENEQLTADNARLRELLRECVYELMPDAYELRDKIEAAIGEGE